MKLVMLMIILLWGCVPKKKLPLDNLRKSIFKIHVNSSEPRFAQPWLMTASARSTGSGFYIGDSRIMTNAHVVSHGKYITVQRDGQAEPMAAYVEYIAHDNDLAILRVDDEKLFSESMVLKFGDLPSLRDEVATVGYPRGGEQISVTEGVVSRVSYRRYAHPGYDRHLLIQVDSAINPGNSGGPVFKDDRVIGVAFQSHTKAENTGYIIPTVVVERFLKDIADGQYDGHPKKGIVVASGAMENEGTRAFHGLESAKGVKIVEVTRYSPFANYLLPGDVLLSLQGMDIGVDGKLDYFNERIDFNVLIDLALNGDVLRFELVRDGAQKTLDVPLKKSGVHYNRSNIFTQRPRFFIHGGLVFTALSRDYLKVWGGRWYYDAPLMMKYLHRYSHIEPRFQQLKDIVVLAGVLPDRINIDASQFRESILDSIDGVEVKSLEELKVQLLEKPNEIVRFKFWNESLPLLLDRKSLQEAHEGLLKRYNVGVSEWLGDEKDDGAVKFEGRHD